MKKLFVLLGLVGVLYGNIEYECIVIDDDTCMIRMESIPVQDVPMGSEEEWCNGIDGIYIENQDSCYTRYKNT